MFISGFSRSFFSAVINLQGSRSAQPFSNLVDVKPERYLLGATATVGADPEDFLADTPIYLVRIRESAGLSRV